MKLIVYFTVSGIKTVIPGHFEMFFRDMLDKQFNKVNSRKSLSDERIVFMPVVMEGHVITVVGVNSGKCNHRAAKIAADIFDNGFRIAEIWFCINIKAVFVPAVYFGLRFFKRSADTFSQFI